jgi:hypothetical protein
MRDLGRQLFERCGDPLRDQKVRVEAAIRGVLDPEQQRRYDELLEERREHLWIGPGFFRNRGEAIVRAQGGTLPPTERRNERRPHRAER